MLFSFSTFQYPQSSRKKTEVYGIVRLVFKTRILKDSINKIIEQTFKIKKPYKELIQSKPDKNGILTKSNKKILQLTKDIKKIKDIDDYYSTIKQSQNTIININISKQRFIRS